MGTHRIDRQEKIIILKKIKTLKHLTAIEDLLQVVLMKKYRSSSNIKVQQSMAGIS